MLSALAEALRLNGPDRDHLQRLVTATSGPGLCPSARSPAIRVVRPTVHTLLDRLDPAPAFVIDARSDILAWNDGFARLAHPLGMLDMSPPNLLLFTLGDERARDVYPDWADVLDQQVAHLHEFRQGDPETEVFAEHLTQVGGPEFTDRWSRRPLAGRSSSVRSLTHPEIGVLRLACEVLALADTDRQQLIVYMPADEATAVGLSRLDPRETEGVRSIRSSRRRGATARR